MRNNDLRTELEYFSEDYDEERDMEPRPEPVKAVIPPLRAASPRSSLTFVYEGQALSNNVGGNLPPNAYGLPFANSDGKPPIGGSFANLPQGGHPMYTFLNMPAYANPNSTDLFPNPLGPVTPFVRLIEDYPLPDGLKMPSHIGSYDGKGDPDNFLHLFEGAIRMQKWLMPIACHMFTYTLKDSERIWWNSQKAGSILDYEDLKAKFRSHFSQQKKFTKTHLAVHNIKKRENKSTRAFITRYTDDTLQILGLHEDQRISGFIHSLRTRSLVKHLSTDLPPTYKGLMEKTYTRVKAREVATNGVLNDRRDSFERPRKSSWNNNKGQMDKNYGHETNKCRELKHQIEEAVKTGQLAHLVKGVTKKREKTYDTQSGEKKKEENPALEKTSILIVSGRDHGLKKRPASDNGTGEITFPPIPYEGSSDPVVIKVYISGRQVNRAYLDIRSSCKVIYEHCFLKLKPLIRSLRVDSNTPLVGFLGEESWPLGKGNSTNNGQGDAKDILSCIDIKEKIVIDDEYPEQKVTIGRQLPTRIIMRLRDLLRAHADVFTWTTTHITRVLRTLIIGEETFSTEHQLNVFNHTEPVKQKKRSMAAERNKVVHTQVEELVEAGVLREVKYLTWVSNPIIVKKDDGKWKLRIDFTNINKACIREPHPLPAAELGAENLHKYRLKCFLDAYKGYHQIPMAEKDEEKTTFFIREGVFLLQKATLRFKKYKGHLQRLIDKVFGSQIGRNMEANTNDMVIKIDTEEEMLADIEETLGRLRAINLKLNPRKCSSGVEEGIYLDHLITKQGIRVDPSKVKAISALQPPKTVSEIQSFGKKLAALNKFLSKSVEKALPFMKTLKSCTSGKIVQWKTKANEAFRRMKECLESLPTMVIPTKGETLTVYLAASKRNVSAILMVERGKKQALVYFVSRTLHEAEHKYPKLENLILALMYTARKLRRYFQAHPIQVLSDMLIKQILADYLTETSPMEREEVKNGEAKRKEPELENTWKLFTDEALSSDGSGAGLIYSIEHIKREQNKKVGTFSKLASMTFSKLAKEVLVEVIQTKSVIEKEITDVDNRREAISKVVHVTMVEVCRANAGQKHHKGSPLPTMLEECKGQIIILDNGKQFAKGTFPVFCKKLGTLQALTSVYHTQANGQVEATNREIVKGMEQRLGMPY
ncbi:reverse transcriptase domain-containing protein [Tanacetum coccineum]